MKQLTFLILTACKLLAYGQWALVGPHQFSAGGASKINLRIGRSGTPYVAFADASTGNKVTVMKYNGTNWVLVGTAGLSANAVQKLDFEIDRFDSLYVVYSETSSNNLFVKKFNGSAWNQLGNLNYSSSSFDMALDTNGVAALVTYSTSLSQADTLCVKSFSNNSWVQERFQAQGPISQSDPLYIGFGTSNTLYVGYNFISIPFANSQNIMKKTSNTWQLYCGFAYHQPRNIKFDIAETIYDYYNYSSPNASFVGFDVKPAGGSATTTYTGNLNFDYLDMDLDSASIPYFVKSGQTGASQYKILFARLVSSSISAVVTPFQAPASAEVKLAFDKGKTSPLKGALYIAFQDTGSAGKLTVIVNTNPTGIEKRHQEQDNLTVYPNPSDGRFEISIVGEYEGRVTINNTVGKSVFTGTISKGQRQISADLKDAASGVYLIQFKCKSGTLTKKLVIAK